VQSAAHLPSPLRPSTGRTGRLAFALLLGILCYATALLASGASVPDRAAWLRLWSIAAAGVFAVATPNVLLPDRNAPVLQVLNWPPGRLLWYQLRQLLPVLVLFLAPAALLAFFSPSGLGERLGAKTAAFGQALLVVTGALLDSFVHYGTIGERSQAWHEGRSGQWYTATADRAGGVFSVPRGLVPALFATVRCFALALGVVLLGATGAQQGSAALTWAPGAAFCLWGGVRLLRARGAFDRHFYHTHAFYGEVLGGSPAQAAERAPVPFDAVYWVPRRLRPAVWASLRQLDRRLPLGRLVALAHLTLWILCARGLPADVVGTFLLLVLAGQNAASALLIAPTSAPLPFHLSLQSPLHWWGVRAFVNLRWLPAHAISLGLVALFDASYGPAWVAAWTAGGAALAVATAGLLTYAHEGRTRQTAT
jgi:hypothetical protein